MTTPFSIRETVPADLQAIAAIYAHAVLHGTASFELEPPDQAEMTRRFGAIADAGYPYLSAVDDAGALLGYGYAGAYRARPAYRWTVEDSVYVDPAAQGRGVGRSLLQALIERCQALGFRQMIAVIGGSEHVASIRLHEQFGFRRAGLLPATGFKHGRWLDSVLMQRSLGAGDAGAPDPDSYPGTLYRPS